MVCLGWVRELSIIFVWCSGGDYRVIVYEKISSSEGSEKGC